MERPPLLLAVRRMVVQFLLLWMFSQNGTVASQKPPLCEDIPGFMLGSEGHILKGCAWVALDTASRCYLEHAGKLVRDFGCRKTCHTCTSATATSDSAIYSFLHDGNRSSYSSPSKSSKRRGLQTCFDDPEFIMKWGKKGKKAKAKANAGNAATHDCSWVGEDTEERCGLESDGESVGEFYCPMTCDLCSIDNPRTDHPSSEPSEVPSDVPTSDPLSEPSQVPSDVPTSDPLSEPSQDIISADMNTEHVVIPQPPSPDPAVYEQQTGCPHKDDSGVVLPQLEPFESLFPVLSVNQDIIIPADKEVLVGNTIGTKLGYITIPETSKLIFGENPSGISVDADGFIVNGALVAGSESCRYMESLTITLHGTRPADIIDSPQSPEFKGISVTGSNAVISFHGKRYYRTWTRLAKRALAGENTILLQDAVNWEVGQKIVVVTTASHDSRSWHQNEEHEIAAIQTTGLTPSAVKAEITLTAPLQYDHIARMEYQGEVGLLTRTIKIQGNEDDSEPTDTSEMTCTIVKTGTTDETKVLGYDQFSCPNEHLTGFGGHVMVHNGGTGYVEGVEFFRMGQTNVLGRYPMHFHVLAEGCTDCFLRDSSIHHSFYRCISIHGTNHVEVSENVGYDVIGYCYYLEDGVEEQNTLSYNLAAHIHVLDFPAVGSGQDVEDVKATNDLTLPADITASGFYITNMHNTIIGNSASGGWAGYAFPILTEPVGLHRSVDMSPLNRPSLLIDGNTAHSTGQFWSHGAAFYFGGTLYFDGNDDLWYNAGRDRVNARKPCVDFKSNGGCNNELFNVLTNSKVFQAPFVGIGSWSGKMEVIDYEAHDFGLSLEALVDGFWIHRMIATCRTGETLALPVQDATRVDGDGFRWYDTGQEHILTESTFRNCGYNSAEYDQYNTLPDRGCNDDPLNGCSGDSSVMTFLTHSDEFNPEVMQATSDMTYDNVGRIFKFTRTQFESVSGRLQNWYDADGTASPGMTGPTLIASGFDSANLWWKVDDGVFVDEQAPVVLIPEDEGTARGLAHIRLAWDETLHATVGSAGDVCKNGRKADSTTGVFGPPCDPVGYIRHLGPKFSTDLGLPVTANPDITGLAGGYGWLFHLFDEAGNIRAPHTLKIFQVEVLPETPLYFSVQYPTGTTFDIKAKSQLTCAASCARQCEEPFSSVGTVEAARNSIGNVYHFDDVTGLLTLRVIMAPGQMTGLPDWQLWTFDDPGYTDQYALNRFERNGILLPKKGNDKTHILIEASCSRDGAFCVGSPPVTTAFDDAVCETGFDQLSYDRCCSTTNPTVCDTPLHGVPEPGPEADSGIENGSEFIENGDFEFLTSAGLPCPWASRSGGTLEVVTDEGRGNTARLTRSQDSSGFEQDLVNFLVVGNTYRIEAEMKVDMSDSSLQTRLRAVVLITQEDGSGTPRNKSTDFCPSSLEVMDNAWTDVSCDLTLHASHLPHGSLDAGPITRMRLIFRLNQASANGVFWVDNVSLTELL